MAKKRKRRSDAATEAPAEVAEQGAPAAAAADSATPGKAERRRGVDATAEQEASAAVQLGDPADSGMGTTDGEGKKPRRKKKKRNRTDQSPGPPASNADAAATGKSGTDVVGVQGDAEVSVNQRNGDDPDRPEVNIGEKGSPERKKKKKKKMQKIQLSPAVVSDDNAVDVDKSRTDCKGVDDVPGDDGTSRGTGNEEDPEYSAEKIAEQEIPKRKKRRLRTRKNNKQDHSPSAVTDGDAVVVGESGNDCTHGKGAPGVAVVSISSGNGDDQDCSEVNLAEKETLERKKRKLKKPKYNKQERSPAAVSVDGAVQLQKSENVCIDGDGTSGDAQVSVSTRNVEDPCCPEANNAEEGTNEMLKPKPKKRKNIKEGSSSVVLDAGAVVADESTNGCKDGDGARRDLEASICPRNGEDSDCPVVNFAEKGIPEMHKPKRKKRKKKNQQRSPSAVLDAGDAVMDAGDAVMDTSGHNSTNLGDTSNDLVEGKDGNNNSLKPKNKKRKRKGENHKENVQDIYSPEGSLVRFKRKKLLILDLNGILADITTERYITRRADGRVRGKNVFKRNYLDDFLRFCFQNFELGIWSSRMKVNVDAVVDILMKDLRQYLLFCWDASQCTITKCGTLENNSKPLVLKELKKLWNKEDPYLPWEQGEFSPSNTLLVDDSPYKALRNPPHTAIFPQSYSYHMKEDDSLGPGGDLRVYLENIAAADDVQRYVQEHPFGQPSITESDPHWNFYAKIHYRLDRLELSNRR